MAIGCTNNCMKYILLFFNLIVFILGIAGIALGTILLVKKDLFLEGLNEIDSEELLDGFNNATIKAGAIILIIASVVILIISFMGCFGAWRENKCLLGTYSTFMFILLALQVAVFIMIIVAQPKLKEGIKIALKKLFDETKDSPKNKKVVEDIFEKNKCCGIETGDGTVTEYSLTCTDKTWPGCYTRMENGIKKNLPAAIGIAVAIILVQLFLIIFACCLCSASRGETLS